MGNKKRKPQSLSKMQNTPRRAKPNERKEEAMNNLNAWESQASAFLRGFLFLTIGYLLIAPPHPTGWHAFDIIVGSASIFLGLADTGYLANSIKQEKQ